MIAAPRGRSRRLALRAAGFIATRTSGASPGVSTLWSAKCSWKLETPGSVPWGARISAGKFGSVDRSLPSSAVCDVKRSPVSCMPSPANRMTTRSSFWTSLALMLCDVLELPYDSLPGALCGGHFPCYVPSGLRSCTCHNVDDAGRRGADTGRAAVTARRRPPGRADRGGSAARRRPDRRPGAEGEDHVRHDEGGGVPAERVDARVDARVQAGVHARVHVRGPSRRAARRGARRRAPGSSPRAASPPGPVHPCRHALEGSPDAADHSVPLAYRHG